MSPLVSVVTPIYNCSQFLKESIFSVLTQDFCDYEFLIFNDGSTDSSVNIVEQFKDPRIKFFDDKKNIRIPRRRNQAISSALGKYIAIHDGDDISLPGRFKMQVDFLESNNDIFCVGGHAIKVDSSGNETGKMDYPPANHEDIVTEIIDKVTNPMIDPTTMFRRNVFNKLGQYTLREDIYTVPDFDVWTRAILKGFRFANIQEFLIKYRDNPDGMTLKHKDEMIRAFMAVWRPFVRQSGRQPAFLAKRANYNAI